MSDEPEITRAEPAIYNIGAVTRMTEIPVATLRAWERRYDFPQPARTMGKHRLYTESEIQRLRWVKARLEEGLQIRHAIEALRQRELSPQRVERASLPLLETFTGSQQPETSLLALTQRLQLALFNHRTDEADGILNEALALYPLEELIYHTVIPVLREAGEAWAADRITVVTEHLATTYLRHRLAMWLEAGPPPYAVSPVVLACAPDEWHESSLLMFGVLLRRRRWPVIHLGQSVPLPDLAAFVQQTAPPAVVLVAMRAESAMALADWPRWLPEAARTGRPLMTFGGRIFVEQPEWQTRIPGLYLGDSLRAGLETLDGLLQERAG